MKVVVVEVVVVAAAAAASTASGLHAILCTLLCALAESFDCLEER